MELAIRVGYRVRKNSLVIGDRNHQVLDVPQGMTLRDQGSAHSGGIRDRGKYTGLYPLTKQWSSGLSEWETREGGGEKGVERVRWVAVGYRKSHPLVKKRSQKGKRQKGKVGGGREEGRVGYVGSS